MFKLIQFPVRILILLLFVFLSPLILIVSCVFAKSFKEAMETTTEIITMPMQDIS